MHEKGTPPLNQEEKQALSYWEPQAPRTDFSSRVVATLAAQQRRRRMITAGASLSAIAAALFAVIALWPEPSPIVGALSAEERREQRLGERGVAVVEPGASLEWKISSDGEAQITQERGDIFYRIEPGGPFVVKTPAGSVTVKGTCFRVEVEPMKQAITGGLVGAVLATTVAVTVYEGKVALANEKGGVALVAGEKATTQNNSAPQKIETPPKKTEPGVVSVVAIDEPSADITREELLARDATMRKQIASLQAKVQELEESNKNPKHPIDNEDSWFEPSQELLQQMAKECRLPWDEPAFDSDQDLSEFAKEAELSQAEVEALKRAQEITMEGYTKEMRGLYLEATGSQPSEDMSADAMIQEIQSKSNRDDIAMANYLITQERAGNKQPPADLSKRPPIERALRLRSSLGNVFEKNLAELVGAERAHEIRGKNKGWPRRGMMMGGCNGLNENPPQ